MAAQESRVTEPEKPAEPAEPAPSAAPAPAAEPAEHAPAAAPAEPAPAAAADAPEQPATLAGGPPAAGQAASGSLGQRRRKALVLLATFSGIALMVATPIALQSHFRGTARDAFSGSPSMGALVALAELFALVFWLRGRGSLLGEGGRGIAGFVLPALVPLAVGLVRGQTARRVLRQVLDDEPLDGLQYFRVIEQGSSEALAQTMYGAFSSGVLLLAVAWLGVLSLRTLPDLGLAKAVGKQPWAGAVAGVLLAFGLGLVMRRASQASLGPHDALVFGATLLAVLFAGRLTRDEARLRARVGDALPERVALPLALIMLCLPAGLLLVSLAGYQFERAQAMSMSTGESIDPSQIERILVGFQGSMSLRPLLVALDFGVGLAVLPMALDARLLAPARALLWRSVVPLGISAGVLALGLGAQQVSLRGDLAEGAAFFDRFRGVPGLALPVMPRWWTDPPRAPAVLVPSEGNLLYDQHHGTAPPELLSEAHIGRYLRDRERSQDDGSAPLPLEMLIAADVSVPFGNVRAISRLLERTRLPWRYYLLVQDTSRHQREGELMAPTRARVRASFSFLVVAGAERAPGERLVLVPEQALAVAFPRKTGNMVPRGNASVEARNFPLGTSPGEALARREALAGVGDESELVVVVPERATVGQIVGWVEAARQAGLRAERVVLDVGPGGAVAGLLAPGRAVDWRGWGPERSGSAGSRASGGGSASAARACGAARLYNGRHA
jgi:hypothetical protein